jgi:uncharacterized membrane protein YbhN (UPF0104 family)
MRSTSRTVWRWVRVGLGAGIVVLVIARVGADPFLDAVRMTSIWALMVALGITTLTTACCAWRWSLVARGLGVDVSPSAALAAYYRSQFLNATLPGGVLGDVHRAVRHGHEVGDPGRGLRSVAWERALGQFVQIALTAFVLLVLPSPFRSLGVALAVAVTGVSAGAVVLARCMRFDQSSKRRARVAGAVAADLRAIMRGRGTAVGIVLASVAAAIGHALIFLVAVRTAGGTASTSQVLPLALLVLSASAVPMNVAGWGPREGVAAWAFSAAGLSATLGVTTGVVYGVMALIATVPGAVVLMADGRRSDVVRPVPTRVGVTADG